MAAPVWVHEVRVSQLIYTVLELYLRLKSLSRRPRRRAKVNLPRGTRARILKRRPPFSATFYLLYLSEWASSSLPHSVLDQLLWVTERQRPPQVSLSGTSFLLFSVPRLCFCRLYLKTFSFTFPSLPASLHLPMSRCPSLSLAHTHVQSSLHPPSLHLSSVVPAFCIF